MPAQIAIDYDQIAAFCQKWQIRELALFGSVLRDDFRPDSDIDVLITFQPGATPSLFTFAEMREELVKMFGREVDLVTKDSLRNPYRRRHILDHHEVIYVA